MQMILAIAAGGALGTLLRHFLNTFVVQSVGNGFPWGIFLINILGSFVMGLLVSVFAHVWQPSQAMKSFLTVGILGGFTTFSTFSLDSVLLLQRGTPGLAILYMAGSVGLATAALYGGMLLVRAVTA